MPEHAFMIYFNFPLENTGKLVCIEAVVEPNQTDHYYNIHSFRNFNGIKKQDASIPVILPEINIKQHQATKNVWVHIDSDEPSILSSIVGKAIEGRVIH